MLINIQIKKNTFKNDKWRSVSFNSPEEIKKIKNKLADFEKERKFNNLEISTLASYFWGLFYGVVKIEIIFDMNRKEKH